MDDVKKLLDNGFTVRIFRNWLGSYTAQAKHPTRKAPSWMGVKGDGWITDDFEPSKALQRLTEKVFLTGQYAEK